MSTYQIDLLLWSERSEVSQEWNNGQVGNLGGSLQAATETLAGWANSSRADYLLLWSVDRELPAEELLSDLISTGLDLAHCGLRQGMGAVMPGLQLVIQDWSMINAAADTNSTSWRLRLDACLVRRELMLKIGGLDKAFLSLGAAGLELGYRCLSRGALVEYRPELWTMDHEEAPPEIPAQDLHSFVIRHFGNKWARYVALRHGLSRISWFSERRSLRAAYKACMAPAPIGEAETVWFDSNPASVEALIGTAVSVIIPTLGRYDYVPKALASLRRQTIKPREVIVVDQNPSSARQPEVYRGYDDLNLRVIWQDERGQSLARNTGLAAANCPYVFLFDDDSVAHDDLIEAHLRYVVNGRFQVSTGVAYPPAPSEYRLPYRFRYPRVAQTFDTGNSLLPLAMAKDLGGLDRNYDHGPGADLDFGTRLYLRGQRIVHNPEAARIHFKAPSGGLRVYDVHKYNTDSALFKPFPAITQSYYGLRYLTKKQLRERTLIQFTTSKLSTRVRRGTEGAVESLRLSISFLGTCILLPMKWYFSKRKARQLLAQGVRLGVFESNQSA